MRAETSSDDGHEPVRRSGPPPRLPEQSVLAEQMFDAVTFLLQFL